MRVAMFALCLGLCACPSGFRLQVDDGAEPSITNDTWRLNGCTKLAFEGAGSFWREQQRAHIHCAGANSASEQLVCSSAPGHRDVPTVVGDTSGLVSQLSFVHLSDAQLKEHTIQIQGPLGNEETYDGLVNGSNRNRYLEQNDDAVLLATVLSINEMKRSLEGAPGRVGYAGYPAPKAPTFAIHTGDSVDAGMFSELLQFLGAMDQLDIAYYNAIGNHDNLFFGTFPGQAMSGLNLVVPYVPIVTSERFMRYHSVIGKNADPSLPYPSRRNADHGPTKEHFPGSLFHGFDLNCPASPDGRLLEPNALCGEARGYYAFDVPMQGRSEKVRMIVLNTAEIVPETIGAAFGRRSQGNMLPAQLAWLRSQLQHEDCFFLVFGHHNLGSFLKERQADEIKALLFNEPRVLGYITGHTHVDAVVEHRRTNGGAFWEIIGGSTLVYPQLGRLVEILEEPGKRLLLRVLSFRQRLGQLAGSWPDAQSEAARCVATPHCDEVRGLAPDLCRRLAERSSFGRGGAKQDDDADKRDERAAVEAINGVMTVFEFKEVKQP